MDISDQDLLNFYNTAKESGHPDPVGFVARSGKLSGFDNGYADHKKFGITGVRAEDLARIGLQEAGSVEETRSRERSGVLRTEMAGIAPPRCCLGSAHLPWAVWWRGVLLETVREAQKAPSAWHGQRTQERRAGGGAGLSDRDRRQHRALKVAAHAGRLSRRQLPPVAIAESAGDGSAGR